MSVVNRFFAFFSLSSVILISLFEKVEIRSHMREAMFYKSLKNKKVVCELCPRYCIIKEGQRGFCRNRENKGGKLYNIAYGRPCSVGEEPIEKAPFFHFKPGALRITLATASCNQRCKYCQNWTISQRSVEEVRSIELSPEDVVRLAQKRGVGIICFTYTEPIVFYEYMYDIARLAKERGLKAIVVTAGYINPEPLEELCKVVDAIKVDLKGFNEDFYEKVCGSSLTPVLEGLKIIRKKGIWLEIVNLVVPTLNDDSKEIRRMCEWIKENLGADVPLHFTRFFPNYQLTNLPPTPISTLEKAHKVAKEVGLRYVYVGNVPGNPLENTYCPFCEKLLIRRMGFSVLENNVFNGKCKFCKKLIHGVW